MPGDRKDAEAVLAETQAARDVLAERRRQIEVEGWTPRHDDRHRRAEMAAAASCYAMPPEDRVIVSGWTDGGRLPESVYLGPAPKGWRWHADWWKPKGRRRDLVRAGALILAEIERLDRAAIRARGAGGVKP